MTIDTSASALLKTLRTFSASVLMLSIIAMSFPLSALAQAAPEAPIEPAIVETTDTPPPAPQGCDTGFHLEGEECVADEPLAPAVVEDTQNASGPTDEEIRALEEDAEDDFMSAVLAEGDLSAQTFSFLKPKLKLKKVLINDNGGTAAMSSFSVTITKHRIILPDQSITVPFDADGEVTVFVDPTISIPFTSLTQHYSVVENAAAGYDMTGAVNCSNLTFDLGDTETCTITNNDQKPKECSIVSNTTDLYVEENENAVATWVHGAWADLLSGATWIWGDAQVQKPRDGETQTFVKDFTVTGTPTVANLQLAADNGALVKINGTVVLDQLATLDGGDQNYDDPADSVNVLSYLVPGTNSIEITVVNLPYNTDDYQTNPAGLIYKLDIKGADCNESEAAPKAFLHATKVMCEDEAFLPNRSGGADITATTAADWVAQSNGKCWLEDGWKFEWTTDAASNTNPGDNDLGPTGGSWAVFGATDANGIASTLIPAGAKIWVREIMQADTLPYSGLVNDPVSAEMWCSTDVLNYDNWDWVDPVAAGNHYYCVAFNAPEIEQCDVDATKVIVSDATTNDQSGPASIVTFLHDSWLEAIDAVWIWKDPTTSASDAANGATETFTKTFAVVGTPLGASLDVAADNQITVKVNGNTLFTDTDEHNYEATTTYAIPANLLQNGTNTITFTVTNIDHQDVNTPETNPAGLLYKLTFQENECVVPAPTKATVSATKIMCDAEQYLPNGNVAKPISAATAANWVAQSGGHCWLEDGYQFQWAPGGTADPADNGTAPLGAPWTTFGPTDANGLATAQVTVADVSGVIQVREVLKAGDTLFSGSSDSISAEIYCANDAAGYDNWDWISGPVAGNTYHCVAFNANPGNDNPNNPGDDKGTLVLVKHALGGDGTFDFSVDDGNTVPLSPSAVSGHTVTTIGGAGTTTLVVDSDTYAVTESPEAGWSLQSVSCVDTTGTSYPNNAVVVQDGKTVTCTFANTKDGEPTSTSDTVIVTGNTSAGENQPGWMFNRDLLTSTPFSFQSGNPSVGTGSLFVPPIANTNASGAPGNNPNKDKFIGELFLLTPLAGLNSITYDFKIAAPDATFEEQFYMSVYATFGESPTNKFYDCRYDVVPTTGSTGSFTTVTFVPTQSYAVTTSGTSPHACPASPSGMNALDIGSPSIRAVALNVGDTSGSDTGVSGYLDRVVTSITTGSNTHTTTYDFEPTAQAPSSNGGGSNRSGNTRGSSSDDGEVLGASTCAPLLTQYLHLGWNNDAGEVTKLQEFLNSHLGIALPVTGFFGDETFAAVKTFQQQYWDSVLKPWFGRPDSGIQNEGTPTGFVYQTTRWQINNIWCEGSEAFPETLI